MNILLIDCDLGPLPDHNVKHVHLPLGGLVSIFKFLGQDENGEPVFYPDLIVQREQLGARIFLLDLEKINCLKVFWAIDSHLNLHWQTYYARLFDVLLTPHTSLFKKDHTYTLLPPLYNFSVPGHDRKFIDFDKRVNNLAFVGRITAERVQRQTFAQYLARYNCVFKECSFNEMLNLYSQTKLLPNEAIAQEFNFRIMEGASCGCCVLTEDIGDDLSANFLPGKEVLTFRHVLELDELIKFCLQKPKIAAAIGQAAWEKVQKVHLPKLRTAQLFEIIKSATQHDSKNDAINFVLATTQWARGNPKSSGKMDTFFKMLTKLPQNAEVQNMYLRLLVEEKRFPEAKEIFNQILARLQRSTSPKDDVESCLILFATALLTYDEQLMGQVLELLNYEPNNTAKISLGLDLARALIAKERILQAGFNFQPLQHCPQTAIELLLTLGTMPMDLTWKKLWQQTLESALEKTSLHLLTLECRANLCMYFPENWDVSFNLGYSLLKNYKLEDGLKELKVAYDLAYSQGKIDEFNTKLRNSRLHL